VGSFVRRTKKETKREKIRGKGKHRRIAFPFTEEEIDGLKKIS